MSHSVALNFADGKTFFISVQSDELLLDAAVRQGINLPLDCREFVRFDENASQPEPINHFYDRHFFYHTLVHKVKVGLDLFALQPADNHVYSSFSA